MLKIISLIGATLLLHSCSDFNKEVGLKDDNPIEQAIEEMVKDETGIVIDFTPDVKKVTVTPEPGKVTITPEKK